MSIQQEILTYFNQLAEEEPILILDNDQSHTDDLTEQADHSGLQKLETNVSECTKCELSRSRNNVVFGTGNSKARLMFIGEAPGADEDRQGLPFVGRAGQLLNKIIAAMGFEREEVYIANILKCRPPGNRDPQPQEVEACIPYLKKQIRLIEPDVMVSLGKVSAVNLLDLSPSVSVKSLRGRIFTYEDRPLVVTYHPAALLRSAGYKKPTWEDMQMVMKLLSGEIQWQPEVKDTLL
ncbi:MAG: uracil-DNA glycosylase [Calditrichaeota bacterium]|nr:uracil-DNA glycosylase [Calditrichota bacterium]